MDDSPCKPHERRAAAARAERAAGQQRELQMLGLMAMEVRAVSAQLRHVGHSATTEAAVTNAREVHALLSQELFRLRRHEKDLSPKEEKQRRSLETDLPSTAGSARDSSRTGSGDTGLLSDGGDQQPSSSRGSLGDDAKGDVPVEAIAPIPRDRGDPHTSRSESAPMLVETQKQRVARGRSHSVLDAARAPQISLLRSESHGSRVSYTKSLLMLTESSVGMQHFVPSRSGRCVLHSGPSDDREDDPVELKIKPHEATFDGPPIRYPSFKYRWVALADALILPELELLSGTLDLMGRGLPPLTPDESPRQRMPKTTLPSIYPPDEARRLKRPGGRYFPAEKLSAATLPARAPSIPKPKVARPLNASLKGFAWRVSEEKIRPSADMADKVYYAPVVPGIPTQRKRPRRPKTLEPLPLGTIAHVRKKVLSALSSALRTEELPEDLSYRVLGTVENALEELDLPGQEVEFSPKPIQTLQFVQRPEVQPPAIEEVREEPEKQEDHVTWHRWRRRPPLVLPPRRSWLLWKRHLWVTLRNALWRQ
ncbi:unnamed protein product [Durusdinium trenchii]|uniref:Uncharacterized protein n=1 Tax=Durusdinium trenchii TaxID=1381693 RepID=A0ABP0PYP9_9DINO